MIAVAFIVGGAAGLLGAIGTLLFTELGWGIALAVYFGVGYGLPLALVAASTVARPARTTLSSAEILRR